jgi:hypothetical protein
LVLDHFGVDIGDLLGDIELDIDEGSSYFFGVGRFELN